LTQNAEQSQSLVEDNQELQWTEGYYRGYFQMHLNAASMEARFFGRLTGTQSPAVQLS
jgi:alkaline phosphatase D